MAELSFLDVSDRRGSKIEDDLDPAGNDIRQGRSRAAIMHGDQIDPRHFLEQLTVEIVVRFPGPTSVQFSITNC